MKSNPHLPFWLISVTFVLALIVPQLIQDGMFMDGMLYTCVAHNMANGIGTFWFPEFSQIGIAGSATFHEHPPLVFGIQAVFFKILGDSMYVERLYSFLTAVATSYLINLVWKLVTRDHQELRNMGWLPILLWILVPVGFWSFQNNMMENTMGIFTLLAVYFSLKVLYSDQRIYVQLILSGVFIFLASFSKGPPGLFPIGVVGLYWLINRDRSFLKIVLYTALLIAIPAFIYAVLLIDADAYANLSHYVNERLLGRIASAPTTDSRFFTIERLGMELVPPILLVGILLVIFKLKSIKQSLEKPYTNTIILFTLIGFSGSLPLMLTMVQKGFYFTPSLPFFGIGLALLVAPGVQSLISKISTSRISFKIFKGISVALLLAVLVVSGLQVGKKGRNRDQLHDVYLLGKIIPSHSLIRIDKSMWNQWSLQSYLIRYFSISVVHSNGAQEYYLRDKDIDTDPPEQYKLVPLPTKDYNLYVLK